MGLPTNQHDALENIQLLVGAGALLYSSNTPELIELAESILSVTQKYSLAASRSNKQKFQNLRTQREACGLTTAELARLLDLDEDIIIQWENGEGEPVASMVIPLANILGCDPVSLLGCFCCADTDEDFPGSEKTIGTRIQSARKKLG
ncbi:TPA: helix-turn-helix transcriptional regulator, partial [Escherichia coli]|nr:helix-turn-helix transcriptional regulator [Escherichia coli]